MVIRLLLHAKPIESMKIRRGLAASSLVVPSVKIKSIYAQANRSPRTLAFVLMPTRIAESQKHAGFLPLYSVNLNTECTSLTKRVWSNGKGMVESAHQASIRLLPFKATSSRFFCRTVACGCLSTNCAGGR